ncbi:hypothetical protein EVAR_56287_1 [Eumeta japonica]|uniref:Uncharacterized protein n=1 Tax=Eumeta variegata TaxID=151549 RepID=A0A4C1YFR7_EUMVA|nr:hypothetical protein EVAR_56287_1 [Eumeta japonica]
MSTGVGVGDGGDGGRVEGLAVGGNGELRIFTKNLPSYILTDAAATAARTWQEVEAQPAVARNTPSCAVVELLPCKLDCRNDHIGSRWTLNSVMLFEQIENLKANSEDLAERNLCRLVGQKHRTCSFVIYLGRSRRRSQSSSRSRFSNLRSDTGLCSPIARLKGINSDTTIGYGSNDND